MKKKQANTNKQTTVIRIEKSDLPLSCPQEGAPVWNMHPKVYLPIEKEGKVVCPYCETHYTLT